MFKVYQVKPTGATTLKQTLPDIGDAYIYIDESWDDVLAGDVYLIYDEEHDSWEVYHSM